jgi:cytochrome c oxidase subunit 4
MVETLLLLALNLLLGAGCLFAVLRQTPQDVLTLDGLFLSMTCMVLALVFFLNSYWTLRSRELSPLLQRLRRPRKESDEREAHPVVRKEVPLRLDHGAHSAMGNRLVFTVWFWLVLITFVEVFLAYIKLGVTTMLILLLAFSVVKAALIIAYFMHLRFEKRSLVWTLIPAMVVTICLLSVFFPDSLRLLELRP